MISQLPWFVARAAGIIAWALLASSVLWGLSLSTRVFGRRPHPAWLLDLHRYLGGLATIFVGVHVVAVVADSYVHFTLWSVLLPFMSRWRPGAIAWGIAAGYLLGAIELTSLIRKHLPRKVWRAVHGASLPLFLLATVHGLWAGSDATTRGAHLAVAGAVTAVAGLTAVKIAGLQDKPPRPTVGRRVVGGSSD